jgi:hypothetical protein
MAAPYISNLAAQILNINFKLKPHEIKQIILETGDEKDYLKLKFFSGSIVNNKRAINAALLSRDMVLDQSITLAKSGLIPMEDSVSIGRPPSMDAFDLKNKVMDSIPKDISPQEIEEIQSTSEESLPVQDLKKDKPDNLIPLPSAVPTAPNLPVDPVPSSQSEGQSPQPSSAPESSSSPVSLQLPQTLNSEILPSSP